MDVKVAASILSADFAHLARDVGAALRGGADYIHFDVMDGHFVPNLTVGAPVCASLRRVTDAVLDVHLMVERPSRYIETFAKAGADILTIHLEAPDVVPVEEALKSIRQRGMKAGLSIRPDTPVEAVLPLLPLCDLLLVMTVEPGFGGQRLIPECMDKITTARKMIDETNPSCELEIDGGVNIGNILDCADAGAEVFVMGSAVFLGDTEMNLRGIKKLLTERTGCDRI